LLGGLDGKQHAVERKGFVQDVRIAFKDRVSGNQVIGAVELNAVPGLVDHRNVIVADVCTKFPERHSHPDNGHVELCRHHVKTGALEHRRDQLSIVDRVREPWDGL
jgi:hypothetical protein